MDLDERTGEVRGAPGAAGQYPFRLRVTDSGQPAQSLEKDYAMTVLAGTPPGVVAAASTAQGVLRLSVRIDPMPEPLASARVQVQYDEDLLDVPRLTGGEAAGTPPVGLTPLGAGLLQLEAANLTRAGEVFILEFDVRGNPAPGRAWFSVLSSDLVSAGGQQRAVLRPTADAGVDRNVRVRFRAGGGLEPTVSDPLGGMAAFLRLDGHESSDPNRPPRPLTYSWVQTVGPTVALAGADSPTPTFVPAGSGEYAFALTVSNGAFSSPPDEVRLLVNAEDSPPTARVAVSGAGAGGSIVAGRDTVTLDARASDDPDPLDSGALRYEWRQTKGRAVELLDDSNHVSPTAPRVHFVPAAPGRAGFELVAIDPHGARSTPVETDVSSRHEAWHVPRLSLQASASTTDGVGEDLGDAEKVKETRSLRVSLPTVVTLKAIVDDPDVGRPPLKHRLTFAWRQLEGPAAALTGAVLANTDRTVSTATFEPTTSRVHVFECVASKLDETGSPTGLEVKRQIRVIVDSRDNGVPEAAFEMTLLRPGRGKAPLAVGRVSKTCSVGPTLTFVRAGARIQMDARCSLDTGPRPKPLIYRWRQTSGPSVVLSDPLGAVTTFVVPVLPGRTQTQRLRFSLQVDDRNDASEPAVGELQFDPRGQVDLPLRTGLNLVSVPFDPSTTGDPYTAEDLLETVCGPNRSGFLARFGSQGTGNTGRFEVYHRGLGGTPFPVAGGHGYLVGGPLAVTAEYIIGSPWPAESLRRGLVRGANLVALPAGTPLGYDAAQLQSLTGASFVARLNALGRFEAYVPQLSASFELQDGAAYVVVVPAAKTVVLPGSQ
ncbi:MAG: hypothetical protein HY814_09950 [Candidatus Riflebacteria bacterium]|nr:hypothetical protein [Candidatus Riflebacteria bacterium]